MLPNFLVPFKAELETFALEAIKIAATPTPEKLACTQSKFLGQPYLPKGSPYPKDKNGVPMVLWCQLNFSEMPHLKGYPKTGILQFFLSAANWYDMDDYQVLFHEVALEDCQTDFSFLPADLYEECPIDCEHKLTFTKAVEYGGSEDCRFTMLFGGKDYWEYEDTLSKKQQSELEKLTSGTGHKVGGYAYFTQHDIRDYNEDLKADVLLLQIDTDEEIMFGDSGVANFFISPEDLKKRAFDKAWFNWDCC